MEKKRGGFSSADIKATTLYKSLKINVPVVFPNEIKFSK